MSMVCPRCHTNFDDRLTCPGCGVALVAPDSLETSPSTVYGAPEGKWQQTPWGRTVVGLLLAQGLYYGLWQLATAIVLATADEASRKEWWSSALAVGLMVAMLIPSLLAGGMLAGAGRRRGYLYGALLGLVNGLLFLVVPKATAWRPNPIYLWCQPLFQMLLGALGGWLGSLLWRPLPSLVPTLAATPPPVKPLNMKPGRKKPFVSFSGPISWVRVLAGSVLAILGSAWANLILKMVLDMKDLGLAAESQQHAKFVTWEISILALLLGAAMGGSNSRNGLKQGLMVGILVCSGLLGIHFQLGTEKSIPAQLLGFRLLDIRLGNMADTAPLQVLIFSIITIIPVGMIGGWFGGQLLPPLLPGRRRKGLFAASV